LIENPDLSEQPGGEKLKVYMVELDYRDQAGLAGYVLDSLRVSANYVNCETQQVLTIWVTGDGSILCLAPPPGRHLLPTFGAEYGHRARDEFAIDLFERLEEVIRRDLGSHGVL
jgi:hypothetical protein